MMLVVGITRKILQKPGLVHVDLNSMLVAEVKDHISDLALCVIGSENHPVNAAVSKILKEHLAHHAVLEVALGSELDALSFEIIPCVHAEPPSDHRMI